VTPLKYKNPIAAASLVASIFVIFIEVARPTTIQILVDGQNISISNSPPIYLIGDMALIGISAFTLGASLIYLLQKERMTVSSVEKSSAKEGWNEALDSLTDEDERTVYELIVAEDGMIFQGELVNRSGFSKSKVSVILDRLEARKVIERKRYGMSNVVVLK
jgi:uncharacterized membrane protein